MALGYVRDAFDLF